jgi:hypothetical protein
MFNESVAGQEISRFLWNPTGSSYFIKNKLYLKMFQLKMIDINEMLCVIYLFWYIVEALYWTSRNKCQIRVTTFGVEPEY